MGKPLPRLSPSFISAYQPDRLPASAPEQPTEWVRWLAANGTLRVLIGTRFWGPAGNGSTAWLERFLVAPAHLQAAQQASGGKLIYLAPPEGALLRYQPASSGGLFEQQSAQDIDAKLNAGTLKPLQFMRQVAVAGDLRVIVPSPCWDRSGLVPGLWNSYEHLSRRRLSAAFLTQDDAARYVRQRVPTGLLRYYGGVILRRDDGWFVATEPLEVPDEVFDIKWVFPDQIVSRGLYPVRTNVVEGSGLWGGRGHVSGWRPFAPAIAGDARYDPPCTPICVQPDDAVRHVHAQVTTRSVPSDGGLPPGLFSPADLIEALYQVHATRTLAALPLYISCADAALLKFLVRDARFTRYDDLAQLRTRALSAGDYIRRMAAAGDLRLLQASDNWRGHVPTAGDERVLALGPIHAHGDDAAWYARRQVGDYAGQQYLSAVLENPQASAWLPVLPVLDKGFPSQVAQRWFPKHIDWPNGYQCRAVHVLFHAGLDQPHAVAEDLYREYFVSWRELAHYIYQLTRDGLPINAFYLSARDGALLCYTPGFSDVEYNLLDTTGKWSEQGGYTRFAPEPSWVVAGLARLGELRVLHAGSFWTRRGAVETKGQQPSDPMPDVPEKDEL